ncbi:AarF/UbiB family protein [Malikia sp.]|uniref:ABC1 kinase family protein n=1 Tax=Malikia sp. TaxID=2070706 RepID=UPI002622D355|nr:AarF/UbiB family protein [Malikia sp.]MDD2729548.1 AarF/UbiB family protein [Malikia sp.]
MLWQALASVRDLGRLHDIASVLIRHGFGDFVRRMGLAEALENAGRALHWGDTHELIHLTPPQRARRVLEELGPTFVKLGQVLSTRVDLFEPEWIAEFGQLQDSAPPVPYAELLPQLVEDLGGPPEQVFAAFNPEPLAAASIAQVHRARLEDGTEVVVKVRRPGIKPVVEADLRWLLRLAQLAESESPELRTFSPQQVVRQFGQSLRNELDFAIECRNATRIARQFEGYTDADAVRSRPDGGELLQPPPLIVVPRVHWQWSGERCCVQDYIAGIPGRKLAEVDAAGLDRKVLARRGARAVLKMIVQDGFFHADPHPGNVFYLPGNRIAFIDFGMVGRLSELRREQLMALLLGLVQQEPARVADVLNDWSGNGAVEHEALIAEIEAFVEQYRGVSLRQLKLGSLLSDLVAILRHHQVTLPADLSLLIKAFVTLEGMGRELDPDFDMAGEALPLLRELLQARYEPQALLGRGWRAAGELLGLLAGLPQDLSRLLRAARKGRLDIHIDVLDLRRIGNQLDRALNRLVVGIVIAALIIGSSIVMTVPGNPSLLGLLGFVGAVIGSLWLFLSIWSANRRDRDDD